MHRTGWFLLVGCFSTPPRPELAPDAPAPACTPPTIRDTFDDASRPVCGDGNRGTNPDSTIERTGGVLKMRPAANVINDAACVWPNFDFAVGTFVEVRQIVGAGGSYTILQVDVAGSRVGIQVVDELDPRLVLFDTAVAGDLVDLPYDPAAMRWLRLRPAGGTIAGEYSADGERWTLAGTSTVTGAPTGEVAVSLNAGVYQAVASPGTAEFDNFGVCP